MQAVAKEIKELDQKLETLDASVKEQAAHLPNLAEADVPVGPDEEANVEVRLGNQPITTAVQL